MIRQLPLLLIAFGTTVAAQWLNYPTPGIPRTPDGKPNLLAPTPRAADGKPDLYGIWTSGTVQGALGETRINRGIRPEEPVLTSEGEALQARRKDNFPEVQCLPLNLPGLATAQPFKIFAIKGTVVFLYEYNTIYRQIFIDGRDLPNDPNPTWLGYSVGKWDGDTLVVDTTGFNDRSMAGGRLHSDALHIIERIRRPDFGHLEIQYTISDPKVYAKPWTVVQNHHLVPDTELLEYICNENEKDLKHMVGGR